MAMYNPIHPGEFIREVYLEPFGITGRQLSSKLGVSPSTLNRILKGNSGVSSEMALRLSKALGRSPESWLIMQDNYDLWHASKQLISMLLRRLTSVRHKKHAPPARVCAPCPH
jgi:addiction module HigA family antidote